MADQGITPADGAGVWRFTGGYRLARTWWWPGTKVEVEETASFRRGKGTAQHLVTERRLRRVAGPELLRLGAAATAHIVDKEPSASLKIRMRAEDDAGDSIERYGAVPSIFPPDDMLPLQPVPSWMFWLGLEGEPHLPPALGFAMISDRRVVVRDERWWRSLKAYEGGRNFLCIWTMDVPPDDPLQRAEDFV